MSEVTTQELQGQLELSRQRFTQVIEQIRSVLVADVGAFVSKSCKQVFLEQTGAADALDDARLGAFKRRAEEVGASAAQRLSADLSADEVWMSGASAPSDDRSLSHASGVWEKVCAVEADTHALLKDFGFETEGVAYQPPRYFVGGLYLPTLVEHYWRLRQEMGALEAQQADLSARATRDRLEARWRDA